MQMMITTYSTLSGLLLNAMQKSSSIVINIRIAARIPQRVENRFTLNAMEPMGKNVMLLAVRLYIGEPEGWEKLSVEAVAANSGASLQ